MINNKTMIDILRNRRSCRDFSDSPLDGESIAFLKEALLRSPTSKNRRPWEFIMVDDREIIEKLSEVKPHGSAFLKKAPLGVVIIADESKSDVWVEDCSIAAITLQYMGESLGLGSCWIQIRKRDHSGSMSAETYVRDVLGIPENLRIASIVALGCVEEKPAGIPFEQLDMNNIRHNGY